MQDDVKWTEMFAALLKHGTNKKGTYDVLKSLKGSVTCEDGSSQVLHLGVWLHKQREDRLKGSLRADKEALLQVSLALQLFLQQYPILPCLALPSPALLCLALACLALACLTLPCPALPSFALPRCALPRCALPGTGPAMPCLVIPLNAKL